MSLTAAAWRGVQVSSAASRVAASETARATALVSAVRGFASSVAGLQVRA
jgi:hypothetical protein